MSRVIFSVHLSSGHSQMLKQGTGWINMNLSLAPSIRRNLKITYDNESYRVIHQYLGTRGRNDSLNPSPFFGN